MNEPALSLHINDQLTPVGAFAEICEALCELVAALSEHAASPPPIWALYEIEREWDGTTVEMRAELEHERNGACAVARIVDDWLDLARRLALGQALKSPQRVARAAERLRQVQCDQGWTLMFGHPGQCDNRPWVIVPPSPVRLTSRAGSVSGPVQTATNERPAHFTVLDQATQTSVKCYLGEDQGRLLDDAQRKFAAVTGTVLEDAEHGAPIAAHEITRIELSDWEWDTRRDTYGIGRWNARDQAAAWIVSEQRRVG